MAGPTAISIILLAIVIVQIKTSHADHADPVLSEDLRGQAKGPCKRRRTEIVFPITRDAAGTVSLNDVTGSPELRGLLHAKLSWRRETLEVILYKNHVTTPGTHSEWTEGNLTLAHSPRPCYYHGYIKGHTASYVALSTCHGLSGFLQTDREMLYIEPGIPIPDSPRQPHTVYTCEGEHVLPQESQIVSTARHQRRVRRSPRAPKFLEVKLVVDYTLWNTIGSKERTESYVMTLMNIANTVFQHKSLGVDIRVVVTKIIYLERRQSRLVQLRNRPLDTVNRFCAWSMKQIPAGSPMDYDIAVLITKEPLGPSGYAPITGLCNPIRSCAAIVDEGFSTGFVIAHETAHVFGLFHDGHGNNCHGRRYQTSLMAPLVESRLNHFWWSECSQSRMKAMVNYLYCLNNEPQLPEGHYPLEASDVIEPHLGKPWSLDFQCRREFGQNFRLCHSFYNDPCNTLWCGTSSHGMCRTKRGPPMPGSPCGQDRECRSARCVYTGQERAVHGQWGAWAAWSSCSNDCGVGVKRRTRTCDDPAPKFGGKKCEGVTDSWSPCVNQTCELMEDVRKGECEVWDSMQIRYGTHKWEPYQGHNESTLCKQTCRSFYTQEVVSINVDVTDGTPCSYTHNNSNICVEGKCLKVGCDGKLNSTKVRDMCGFCGGDGSHCKVVSGNTTVTVKSTQQYRKVITIPSGARDIRIAKTSRDYNYLALKDTRYGRHVLNGDKRQSKTTSLVLNGAMVVYIKQNRTFNENIVSPGPILHALELDFYPNNLRADVNVTYSYTVHKSDYTLEKETYAWKFDKWSPCSVTCGQGHQQIQHKCVDKNSEKEVAIESCHVHERPRQDKVPCIRERCGIYRYNWAMTNEWTECNATKCEQPGQQRQTFVCERLTLQDKSPVQVDQSSCSHLTEPNYPRMCEGPPCERSVSHRWGTPGNWSECPCGRGYNQSREVPCERVEVVEGRDENEVKVVDVQECQSVEGDKPAVSQNCEGEPCPPTYRWIDSGRFTNCTAACDQNGVQRSIRACEKMQEGVDTPGIEMVNDSVCLELDLPSPVIVDVPCIGEPCQDTYRWQATEAWSECRARCEKKGSQRRQFQCQKMSGPHHEVTNVTEDECTSVGVPEVERRSCTGDLCPLKWTLGKWSKCTVTCGQGKMYRTVSCGDPDTDIDDIRCTARPPRTSKVCKRKPCPEMDPADCKDKHSFCTAYRALKYRCKKSFFRAKCCGTCQAARKGKTIVKKPRNAFEAYLLKKRKMNRRKKRRQRRSRKYR